MNCNIKNREGKCDLKEIFTHHRPISAYVVRWCSYCGAVAVDEDFDGRTNPGSGRPAEFPELAKITKDK